MTKNLIFITPDENGGVKDHTTKLANILKDRNKIEIIKIKKGVNNIKKKKYVKSDIIILQYSGYGYSNRGAPYWLLKEIIYLKKKVNKIIIIFHELYMVSYYPWRTAFWTQFLQKFIFKKLLKVSDYSFISTKKYFEKLSIEKKIFYLPSFSNIGEMLKLNHKRENIIVVFGMRETRINTYKEFNNKLFIWAKKNEIKIIDIGPKILNDEIKKKLIVNDVEILGPLLEDQIYKIFKKTKYGLLSYNLDYIDKSGVFNAYAAHGIMPILSDKKSEGFIIKENYHYLSSLPKSINKNNSISKNIFNWYQKHNILKSSNKINSLVK